MMALDLATLLIANTFGTFGNTIFVGTAVSLPENDGPFTTLKEGGGTGDSFTQNSLTDTTEKGWENSSVQIICTGKNYLATASLLARIRALVRVLRNVVIGAYTLNLVNITRNGTTATGTTLETSRLYVGQRITIAGAGQTEYNGLQTVLTIPSSKTFTFTVAGNPTTPATGTLSFTYAGVKYQSLRPTQAVIDLGMDTSGRVRLAFNVRGIKRPSLT